MSNPISTKVHTRIGHERSLCGMNPHYGNYNISSLEDFLAAPEADQCGRCAEHLRKRGYNLAALRDRMQQKTFALEQHA